MAKHRVLHYILQNTSTPSYIKNWAHLLKLMDAEDAKGVPTMTAHFLPEACAEPHISAVQGGQCQHMS